MPIYAYLCDACGHEHDTLQKLSDPVLTVCPVCHAERYRRKLTAAGFQLKGTGWYVTDFRDNGPKKSSAGAEKATGGDAASAPGDAGPAKSPAGSTSGEGASSASGASGTGASAGADSGAAKSAAGAGGLSVRRSRRDQWSLRVPRCALLVSVCGC
jgi:putative FmdB family regulatory protein